MSTINVSESARVASRGGAFAQKVAGATDPGRSMLGRAVDLAAALQLAVRVVPAGWRLMKRYPLSAALITVGLAWGAYSSRSMSQPTPREK